MKRRLLLTFVFVAVAISGWALWVNACDKSKATSATAAAAGSCPSAKAAGCTGEADAASAVRTADAKGGCPSQKSSATAAGNDHCGTAATATAAAGSCEGKGAKGATAAAGSCEGKGAKGATAAAGSCCGMIGGTATAAGSGSSSRKGVSASAAGSSCGMHDSKSAGAHDKDCDACEDMAHCDGELKANGAQTQVVPLRNGVMFVYTTDTPARVHAVQTVVSRRTEKLAAIVTAGTKASLCPGCKEIRGAMASGKLTRETVNIEGGSLTLMTSNDPAMVRRLHGMAGLAEGSRKS